MKVTVETAPLRRAAQALAQIIDRKTPIPILGTTLLTAKGGMLSLRATDLDVEATFMLPAAIDMEGSAAVPALLLAHFLDGLPEGSETAAAIAGSTLDLISGRRRASLPTLPPGDFPELSFDAEDRGATEFAPDTLAAMARFTDLCTSPESDRLYLSGPALIADGDTTVLCAANGAVLGWLPLSERPALPGGAPIIPQRTARALAKLFPAGARILFTTSKLCAETDGVRLISKLMDGTFPDAKRVVPEVSDNLAIEADAAALNAAAKAVLRSSGAPDGNCVRFAGSGGELVVSAAGEKGAAHAEERVAESSFVGDRDIGVNAEMLADVLGALAFETVRMTQAINGYALRIEPPAADGRIGVIMPMRLKG